jgi:3-deoxy-D-manno-octulosonic-acid transferase
VAAASWIGAVSSAHAARWIALGARPESVEVTGDPRHDAVVERVTRLDAIAPLRAWAAGRVVLVAGSLEPDDLEPVLFAIRALLAAHERAAAVLVPHDPAPATVARWVEATRAAALHPAPWAPGLAVPAGRCVVLAAAGMLADLYLLADLAYVGGGFRRGRLHTVLEPAALAVPVMVGPGYGSDDAAAAILRAGGGFALPRRGAGPALWEVCRPLVEDPHVRTAAGLAARGALHQGAASRTARALAQLMGVVSSPFSTRFDARLNLS